MNIFKTISDVREYIKNAKKSGLSVGFVPTMGYLHEGHLSLIKAAKAENDICVVSIFVNPIQFGPNEDFEKYPRDFERDFALCKSENADAVFVPEVSEMYNGGFNTTVEVRELTDTLCGASRPGHFKGVTTVVAKLFNAVPANKAYFGQKDAQQLLVIEKMVRDLNMDIEIVGCPIIRESDGLAMSSRNVYLSNDERSQAVVISKALNEARMLIQNGERHAKDVLKAVEAIILQAQIAKIDYIEIVSRDTMKPIEIIEGKILIAAAVFFGKTRLIDNVFIEV